MGSIIGTNVAPPERVELSLNDPRRERLLHQKPWPRADLCFQWIAPRFLESQSNQLLYCRLIDRKAAYPTAVPVDLEGGDRKQLLPHPSRITAFGSKLSVCVC